MKKIKFPHIDLELNLKTINNRNEISIDYHDIKEIYNVLFKSDIYELGGEYHPNYGFIINPDTSHFDIKNFKPYTILNRLSQIKIVWHSHPFTKLTNFPSIEDIDTVRLNPHLIFLIITYKGIYIISSNEKYLSVDNIIGLYNSMQSSCSNKWNYEELEKSFLENKNFNNNIKNYNIFLYFLPYDIINKNIINKTIKNAYKYKNKSLQEIFIMKLLNKK